MKKIIVAIILISSLDAKSISEIISEINNNEIKISKLLEIKGSLTNIEIKNKINSIENESIELIYELSERTRTKTK